MLVTFRKFSENFRKLRKDLIITFSAEFSINLYSAQTFPRVVKGFSVTHELAILFP